MKSIGNLLNFPEKELTKASPRADVIHHIYELYISETDRLLRKKENWKRFIMHCKADKVDIKDKLIQEKYKKSRFFIREYDIKTFCIRIAHIPTEDLYYILSMSKDTKHRGKSVGAWIFGSIK